jgi:D-alanyl-D-alanine carboxypeptidase
MSTGTASGTPEGRVFEKTGTLMAGTSLSGVTTTVMLGPLAVLAYITIPAPHPHLPADHHNLFAYGVELGLTVAFLFVGGKLVAGRIFRL